MPDKNYDILINIEARVQAIQEAVTQVQRISEAASGVQSALSQAFEFAGALEITQRVTDALREIPSILLEAVKAGVDFNAELTNTASAIAGILRQNLSEHFIDFSTAQAEASKTVDLLRDKANELGQSYQSFFETYITSANAMFQGGITRVEQQVQLVATLSRTLQTLGISGFQATRDVTDLLNGLASRTAAGRILGITDEDIARAKETDTLFQFLIQKLQGFQEAGAAVSQSFPADMQRLQNAIIDLEGEAAKPVMQPLIDGITELTSDLKDGGTLAAIQSLGGTLASLIGGFHDLANTISGAVNQLSHFAEVASVLSSLPGIGAGIGKFGQSIKDLTAGNQVTSLIKESQAGLDALTQSGADLNAQVKAQIDLEQTVFKIKQTLPGLDGLDKTQLQGQLTVLENVLANVKNYAGAAEQLVVKHGQDKGVLDAIALVHAKIALLQAENSGDKEAAATLKAKVAYDEIYKSLVAKHVPEAEATKDAQAYSDAVKAAALHQNDLKNGVAGERDARREITDLIRQDEQLLSQLNAQQRLINQNPFLGADDKQAALNANAIQQQQALTAAIKDNETAMQKAFGEGAQDEVTRLNGNITKLKNQLVEVGYTIETTNFTGQLRAELTQWVNQFGTAAHTAAQVLTTTLNGAIQGTSQALTGLIFGTENWKQAFEQAAESIVGNIITIVLEYTIGRAVMFAINEAFGSSETSASNSQASSAASAWAPAAVAASIASYGAASGIGLAAFLAAVVAGAAANGAIASAGGAGGFAEGGYTGTGSPSAVAGVVHGGEFVFSRPAVRKLGIENLAALHTYGRVGGYAAGGFVGGGGSSGGGISALQPKISIFNLTDEKTLWDRYHKDSASSKFVVRTLNRAGGRFREV